MEYIKKLLTKNKLQTLIYCVGKTRSMFTTNAIFKS